MTIPAISQLKAEARSALEHSRDQKQTALVYSAVLVGSSILVLLLDYLLSRTISDMGGLSNLGTRPSFPPCRLCCPSPSLWRFWAGTQATSW